MPPGHQVVFLTALFYLLRASGERYKPLDLFASMLPGSASRLGEAVEEAVAGVFAASFKMAAFYGLYTWLIHTLFEVKMVYIPTGELAIWQRRYIALLAEAPVNAVRQNVFETASIFL